MVAVLRAAGLSDTYDLLADPATGDRIVCAALVRRGLLHGTPRIGGTVPRRRAPGGPTAGEDPQAPAIAITIPGPRSRARLPDRASDDRPATEVFITHLKSKLPTAIYNEGWYRRDPGLYQPHVTAIGAALSTIRRTAEATGLRVLLTSVMKDTDTPVIVLGDVNDGQSSNTVNILTEQPRYLVGESRGGADNGLYTAQTLQEYRDTPRRLLHPRAQRPARVAGPRAGQRAALRQQPAPGLAVRRADDPERPPRRPGPPSDRQHRPRSGEGAVPLPAVRALGSG